jgi:hypothetical protein
MNSEIEIFLSYLGGPIRVFSTIMKASLIFTLIYYTIYYGVTTVLTLLFIPVLLGSIQFLMLFYIGGLVITLLTLLLIIIILSLKFPSMSKPSTFFGRSVSPSLSIASLVSVAEFVLFEIINAMFVSHSQITTLLIIGFNSSIVLVLVALFMKFRGSVTAVDFITR